MTKHTKKRTKTATNTPPWGHGAPPRNYFASQIIKLLDQTHSGYRLTEVVRDWFEVVEMTLARLPAQAAHAAAHGTSLEPGDDERTVMQRMAARYGERWPRTHNLFAEALALLFQAAETPEKDSYTPGDAIAGPTYADIVGEVYMQAGLGNPAAGQYFTPESVCRFMALMTVADGPRLVVERLREALTHPDNLYGQALLIGTGLFASDDSVTDEVSSFVLDQLVPAALPHYEPVQVSDSACGSGRMLLAAAAQFPRWQVEYGLVQFHGNDIAIDCVRMAKINVMLYGLNGWGLKWKLAHTQLVQRLRNDQQPDILAADPMTLEQLVLPLDAAITQTDDERRDAAA